MGGGHPPVGFHQGKFMTLAGFRAVLVALAVPSVAHTQTPPRITHVTGPFAVGREFRQIVDLTRADAQSLRSDGKREFLFIIWYPAQAVSTSRSPWIPRIWVDSAAADLAFFGRRATPPPSFAEARTVIRATLSNAVDSAPAVPGDNSFPVLLFSPGNNTSAIYYSALAEELASHGYVVIGNVPVGWARSVTFLDGRVTGNHPSSTLDPWIADLADMLDSLPAWNADRRLRIAGRLDLSRIGAYGHSAGANAVEVLMSRDPRIGAELLLDPGLTDSVWATDRPTLLLFAENREFLSRPGNEQLVADVTRERAAFERHLSTGFWMTIRGSAHMMFSDVSAISAFASPVQAAPELATAQAVVVAFFDEVFRGKRAGLIRSGGASWPLLRIDGGTH
jgi:dienelactone hydrolase